VFLSSRTDKSREIGEIGAAAGLVLFRACVWAIVCIAAVLALPDLRDIYRRAQWSHVRVVSAANGGALRGVFDGLRPSTGGLYWLSHRADGDSSCQVRSLAQRRSGFSQIWADLVGLFDTSVGACDTTVYSDSSTTIVPDCECDPNYSSSCHAECNTYPGNEDITCYQTDADVSEYCSGCSNSMNSGNCSSCHDSSTCWNSAPGCCNYDDDCGDTEYCGDSHTCLSCGGDPYLECYPEQRATCVYPGYWYCYPPYY